MKTGDLVRVLEPFTESSPEIYQIERVENVEGLPVFYLVGIESTFSDIYLETV